MKKLGSMRSLKEYNSCQEIELDAEEIYKMPEKEIQNNVSKEAHWNLDNTDMQLKEMWKVIYGINEKFNKEIEIIKKNWLEAQVLKSWINEIKIFTIISLKYWLNQS